MDLIKLNTEVKNIEKVIEATYWKTEDKVLKQFLAWALSNERSIRYHADKITQGCDLLRGLADRAENRLHNNHLDCLNSLGIQPAGPSLDIEIVELCALVKNRAAYRSFVEEALTIIAGEESGLYPKED